MKRVDKKAFTLIELLVVIAVVGILVLLGAPRFVGTVEKAREAQIKNDVKAVESVITDQLTKENRLAWESTITNEELIDKLGEASLYGKTGTLSADIIKGDYIELPPSYVEEMTGSKLDGVFYADYEGGILYLRDSETKYIYVSNARDLQNVKDNLDGHIIQTRDINLEGVSFDPLGNSSTPFTGTYDGSGYNITGLTIIRPETNSVGLFGYTQGATIRNVGLIGNKVTGNTHVGGLVGQAYGSTKISNSYSTGSVKGTGNDVGGLVGQAHKSIIENSYSIGEVTGNSWAGGLVGDAQGGTKITNAHVTGSVTGTGGGAGGIVGWANNMTISNSYTTGSVTGTGNYTGGIVGMAGNSTNISNSYSTSSVTGINDVGGLAGSFYNSTISNSYATGPVKGSGGYVGGLVGNAGSINIENSYATGLVTGPSTNGVGGLLGYAYGTGNSVTNSYWDTETTGQTSSAGGGAGKSTDEMKQAKTYSTWGTDVWNIVNGEYPKLR